jgi:uncharacterized protein (TIGR00251 family)
MRDWKNALNLSNNEVQLRLHVIPDSSKPVFPAGYNIWRNSIEIKVKAEAIENKANYEVIDQIAIYFNIPQKDIRIIYGQKSREKTVAIKKIKIENIVNKIKESFRGL